MKSVNLHIAYIFRILALIWGEKALLLKSQSEENGSKSRMFHKTYSEHPAFFPAWPFPALFY